MSLFITSFFLLCSSLLSIANAALYVTSPVASTVCTAGQPCTIQWSDDGTAPLLDTMGPCTIALYTGKQRALQQIASLDVSDSHSVTFKPDPKAGPDSSQYYVGFTSIKPNENGTHWLAYSASFTIHGMQGSFGSPLPAASSTKPFSSAHGGSQTTTSVISVDGTISVSIASAPQTSVSVPVTASSGFASSTSPGPSEASTSPSSGTNSATASSPSTEPTGAAVRLASSASLPLGIAYLSIPFLLLI